MTDMSYALCCRWVATGRCGVRDQRQMGGAGRHNITAGHTRRQVGRRATSAGWRGAAHCKEMAAI